MKAVSPQELEEWRVQTAGESGWHTAWPPHDLLLAPSSPLGILSHAQRLMLEVGNRQVTTSPVMSQTAFTPFPAW